MKTGTVTIARIGNPSEKRIIAINNRRGQAMSLIHKEILKANPGFYIHKSIRGK